MRVSGNDDIYRRCPCGSGKKYKFCCLEREREASRNPTIPREILASLKEAEGLHQRATALIGRYKGREALPLLERCIQLGPTVPQPHNNLALAHYLEGDIEKALDICERVDRDVDPGNVYALGQRIHYLLLLGRRAEAEALGVRILRLPGRDQHAAYKKCEALARLRCHREVHATALAALPTADDSPGSFAFMAGVAAANLSRFEEAERMLEDAVDDLAHGRTARRLLDRLRRRIGPGTLTGEWLYLEWAHWVSPGFLKAHSTAQEIRKYPGFIEAVTSILDDDAEAIDIQLMAHIGTPEGVDLLRKIAFGTYGTDQMRTSALNALVDQGHVASDGSHRVWLQGEWRSIRVMKQELSSETANPLPEELRSGMGEMIRTMKAKKWARAEELGRGLLEKAPDTPQVLYNLAMILVRRKRGDEAKTLLRRAIAADPGYLFAPASLASLKLAEGKTAEAREILRAADKESGRVNPEGFVLYLLAQADVSAADGEVEEAAQSWRLAEELAPSHPGVKASRNSLARRMSESFADMRHRQREKLEARRRRLLPATVTAEDVLAGRTVGELRDLGKTLKLDRLAGLRKDQIFIRVLEQLKSREAMEAIARTLPSEAREALRRLDSARGAMSFEEFTQAFDPPGPEPRPPSVLSLLRDHGFVAVGTLHGGIKVVIPSELRGLTL